MGNITNVLFLMLALNIAAVLILGGTASNTLFAFVMDPTGGITWEAVLTYLAWSSATVLVTMVGALFLFKNESVLWAGVFGVIAKLGYDPMKDLYNLMSPINPVLAMISVSCLYLLFIITCVNWLRAPR